MNVWAIVLAAGEGRRMGGGKLTLPFGRSTVIGEVARAMLGVPVAGLVVVLGHHADQVRAALDEIPVVFAANPEPEQGMLSSVKCGIRALPKDAEAFLIALGDQPEVNAAAIRALVRAAESSDRWMFTPRFEGKRGHPVLFRSAARNSILGLREDTGLNVWRESHADLVEMVDVDRPAVLRDIDTPEDYREALRRAGPVEERPDASLRSE